MDKRFNAQALAELINLHNIQVPREKGCLCYRFSFIQYTTSYNLNARQLTT